MGSGHLLSDPESEEVKDVQGLEKKCGPDLRSRCEGVLTRGCSVYHRAENLRCNIIQLLDIKN